MRTIFTQQERDAREKIRTLNEAKLYQYKATLDSILEYLHLGVDLNSTEIEESDINVNSVTLIGFQQHICWKIDEHNKLSIGRKNKGKIF